MAANQLNSPKPWQLWLIIFTKESLFQQYQSYVWPRLATYAAHKKIIRENYIIRSIFFVWALIYVLNVGTTY